MSTYKTSRHIDPSALGFPSMMREDEAVGLWTVEADVSLATLKAAVDAAPLDPASQRDTNRATLRAQVRDSLTVLRATVDTLQAITDKPNNQIGPADTKSVARETRRVARQLIAVSRLLVEALDSADTGSA